MNSNRLKGVMCPKCGQTERFEIEALTTITLTDDGVDEYTGAEFDHGSTTRCPVCDYDGVFDVFLHPGLYVTFEIYTDLAYEMGEPDRRGWWMPGEWLHDDKPDTPAFVFDPDDFDPDEHDDLDEAIVEWAVGVLEREGAIHPSCHPANDADWWSTEDAVYSYKTGAQIGKAFHFHNLRHELIERVNLRMLEG